MTTSWRCLDGKQARGRKNVFFSRVTIEQEDTNIRPFIIEQFLQAASRRMIQYWRSKKFHVSKPAHLRIWESPKNNLRDHIILLRSADTARLSVGMWVPLNHPIRMGAGSVSGSEGDRMICL